MAAFVLMKLSPQTTTVKESSDTAKARCRDGEGEGECETDEGIPVESVLKSWAARYDWRPACERWP